LVKKLFCLVLFNPPAIAEEVISNGYTSNHICLLAEMTKPFQYWLKKNLFSLV